MRIVKMNVFARSLNISVLLVFLFLFADHSIYGQRKRKANKKVDQTTGQTEEDKKLLIDD